MLMMLNSQKKQTKKNQTTYFWFTISIQMVKVGCLKTYSHVVQMGLKLQKTTREESKL